MGAKAMRHSHCGHLTNLRLGLRLAFEPLGEVGEGGGVGEEAEEGEGVCESGFEGSVEAKLNTGWVNTSAWASSSGNS